MTTAPTVPTGRTTSAFNGRGASRGAPDVPGWGSRLPHPRRQRRPGLAVAGAVLVLVCGVATAAVASRGDKRVAVLALSRDLPAGTALSDGDLRIAHVAGDGISALAASGEASLVGQTLTATLPAGTLLNSSMLTAASLPPAGMELVAVAVKAGGVPPEATTGRDVSLLPVTASGASGTPGATDGPPVLAAKARVVSIHTDPSSGLIVLSLQVPASVASQVAQASAAGAIAVTLLPVTP